MKKYLLLYVLLWFVSLWFFSFSFADECEEYFGCQNVCQNSFNECTRNAAWNIQETLQWCQNTLTSCLWACDPDDFWSSWWSDECGGGNGWESGGGNEWQTCPNWCCGIKLNTNFPIIWNCIRIKWEWSINPTNAFPYMVWILTKIVMSVILVVCFILVIVAWIMRAGDNPKWAQKLLKRVAITIILLWFSGVILKLLNPNFFG